MIRASDFACTLLALLSIACGDAAIGDKIAPDASEEIARNEPDTGSDGWSRRPDGLPDAGWDLDAWGYDAAACCAECIASWTACCANCTDTCSELVDAGVESMAKCLSDCANVDQAACTPSYTPCFNACGGCGSPNLSACP